MMIIREVEVYLDSWVDCSRLYLSVELLNLTMNGGMWE